MTVVAAVDLGATSGRVARVDLDTLDVDVVRRFTNHPVRDGDGHLRWDWQRIVAETERGLHAALGAGPVTSIGVDTWGVDYGLITKEGDLVAPPFSYRDDRTRDWRRVVDRIGPERIYTITGIQLMAINTLCQLAVHDRTELDRADSLLMLPELLMHSLTGSVAGERTSAGTSQLVDVRTGGWSGDLLQAIGVDEAMFPAIARAPKRVGEWNGVPLHLVGGHDTASAVAAVPDPEPGSAFVSLGTWALVGAERPEADTSPAAMRANFSNEPSVFDGFRFLKNVTGLWMLEECRREWRASGVAELVDAAEAVSDGGPVVDATDDRFLAPASMEAEVRAAGNLPTSAGRDRVARCILDSIATAVAAVVRELQTFVGAPVPAIHVIGGGSQIGLLNRLIGEAAERPVHPGPVEATALGNAFVQGIALGRFADLAEARAGVG